MKKKELIRRLVGEAERNTNRELCVEFQGASDLESPAEAALSLTFRWSGMRFEVYGYGGDLIADGSLAPTTVEHATKLLDDLLTMCGATDKQNLPTGPFDFRMVN